MQKRTYAVVGGGASGIATAFYLRRLGLNAEVIEQGSALGGRMGTCQLGERTVAMGGKNIGRAYHLFREFTAAMGDNPYEYFGLNSSQVRDGKIITVDGQRFWQTALGFLKNCSPGDITRFAGLCAAIKFDERNGYLGGSHFARVGEKLDDQPVAAYFSAEFCKRIIRPMSVRMNGAEPDEIFMGNLGTNLRMLLDNYDQLTRGFRPVLDGFAASGPTRLGTTVQALVVEAGRVVGLEVTDERGQAQTLRYDGVVLATPAPVTARLVAPLDRSLARLLGEVRYFPVAVLVVQYNRNIFSDKVRALVFDGSEPISNANAYGINDRNLIRYTFSGRSARAYLEGEMDTERLVEIAERALDRYIPVKASERVRFVGRQYRDGLCAYTPRYTHFERDLAARLQKLPGLFVTGDYLQGASVEACFRAGRQTAEQVARTQAGTTAAALAAR